MKSNNKNIRSDDPLSLLCIPAGVFVFLLLGNKPWANAESHPVDRDYSLVTAPPSPARQSEADVQTKK